MLKRENELRLSADTQAEYTRARRVDPDGLPLVVAVTERLQQRVAREFGFASEDPDSEQSTARGVELLRSAQALFPGDDEIRAIPLYVRYNRMRRGELSVGDACPDARLLRITDGSDTRLTAFQGADSDRPLVLLAASWS